jgi:hypothetical protein
LIPLPWTTSTGNAGQGSSNLGKGVNRFPGSRPAFDKGRVVLMRKTMQSLANTCCLVLGFVLASGGCDKSSSRPPQEGAPREEKKTTAPAAPRPPADESLTPEKYVELGLPAHDRPWLAPDMVQADKALTAIAQKNPRQLPRYQSEQSGPVFARLTSPQNLEFARNRTIPLDWRMSQALDSTEASNRIHKRYVAAALKNTMGTSELVECLGYQLRAAVVMLDLVDEFLPTMDPKEPDYAARMKGLEQMRQGLAGLVAGGLLTLTERQSYRPAELVRLVGYMKETCPRILAGLSPTSRLEMLTRLEQMNNDARNQDLQPGLGDLLALVRAAKKPTKMP